MLRGTAAAVRAGGQLRRLRDYDRSASIHRPHWLQADAVATAVAAMGSAMLCDKRQQLLQQLYVAVRIACLRDPSSIAANSEAK